MDQLCIWAVENFSPFTVPYKHAFQLGNFHPICIPPWTMPYKYDHVVEEEIETMTIIKPVYSHWDVPVVIAPIMEGSTLFWEVYRAWNKRKNSFKVPLSQIGEILDDLPGWNTLEGWINSRHVVRSNRKTTFRRWLRSFENMEPSISLFCRPDSWMP